MSFLRNLSISLGVVAFSTIGALPASAHASGGEVVSQLSSVPSCLRVTNVDNRAAGAYVTVRNYCSTRQTYRIIFKYSYDSSCMSLAAGDSRTTKGASVWSRYDRLDDC